MEGVLLASPASHREQTEQVERVIARGLSHSEALCSLLRFLAKHSIEHPGSPPKEYQIALEVFHRSQDFDPRVDSTVRVQAARLRAKLAEYYSDADTEDKLVIEIPKGSYAMVFRDRPAALAKPGLVPNIAAPSTLPPPRGAGRGRLIAGVALVLAVAAAAAVHWYLASSQDTVRNFWKGFNAGSEPLLIIFSNADFVGRPETGLRYFDPSRDSRNDVLDHYTGVGEVLAVFELARVFASLHLQADIKRGRLLNWDDTRNRDLVFIGSPSENLALKELPIQHEFVFRAREAPPRRGDLAIVNLHPRPGEQDYYLASGTLPIVEDYGLIMLLPGFTRSQSILILAGTTTFGTQASVEFVCRADRLQELFEKLNGASSQAISPFAGVLRVRISGGVPVESRFVAFRKLAGR
jgi:hypothetical protein